jgi:hypothetical protein
MSDKETKHGTLLTPLLPTDLIGIQRVPDLVHYKAPLSGLGTLVGGPTFEVTQANDFFVGAAICRLVGSWVRADADNSRPCHAIVEAATATEFTCRSSGYMVWPAHGKTLGTYHYLSTIAGGFVSVKPGVPGQIIQRTLLPVDDDTIHVTLGEAWT